MDIRPLVQADLNLLVVLQVLLEEGSVSRAADRLFLSQSAVSKSLARLRDLFQDPLFTRSSEGMVPTPKAQAIKDQLPIALASVHELITPKTFDPASARGVISMAIGEHAGILLLPSVVAKLATLAPGVQLRALNRVEQQLDRLAGGELDFALHMQHQNYSTEFNARSLLGSAPGLIVRDGHPLAGKPVIYEDLAPYQFVRLIMPDQNELEFFAQVEVVKQMQANLSTVFETSHVASAVETIRRTDCILPMPRLMGLDAAIIKGTCWLDFDLYENYTINYSLVNHVRTENSPLHRWVAGLLADAAADLQKRYQVMIGGPR